jgi:ferredoxin
LAAPFWPNLCISNYKIANSVKGGSKRIIIHYGYCDGSGEFYIVIDAMKCDGCGNCISKCPQSALELQTMMMDLEDKTVAAVTEQHRKKIKYTCASCKPGEKKAPCILICEKKAIDTIWNPK